MDDSSVERQFSTADRVVDHLYRDGGGFANYGQPTFRKFCGKCLRTRRGSRTAGEHDPAAFYARELLRDAAPDLLLHLRELLSAVRTATLEDPTHYVVANAVGLAALRAQQIVDRLDGAP